MMKLLFTQILIGVQFLAGLQSLAQEALPDLSGEWTGTVEVGKGYLTLSMDLLQKGLHLEGIAEQKSLNGKDSARYIVKGVMDGKTVHLEGTEFVYKTGVNCLSVIDMTYETQGNTAFMTGRWKGDWKLTTCPPGVSGSIKLNRKFPELEKIMPDTEPVSARQVQIANNDFIGIELSNALAERKYYAFLIGINNYGDEKIQSLDNPVNDAKLLKEVLLKHYTFEDENIILLENPTREIIIEQLDNLNAVISATDQLLVFYAGHGIWDPDLNQGYWLPADARISSKAQWLSNSTIRDYIGGIKAKHTLLITDACFSGSIFKERAVYSESRAVLEMYKLPSRKAMTSGAMKTVPDKSVFIEYLIKTLVSYDQAFLSSDELFRRFKPAVMNNSINGQVPQYGPIRLAGDEGGEFIFLRRAE